MKTCTKCGIEKALSDFYAKKDHKFGVSSECKTCTKDRLKTWRLDNPARYKEAERKRKASDPEGHKKKQQIASLKYNHGFSPVGYAAMLEKQGGKCAICRATPGHRLVVDHNHKTGVRRGLLCRQCNHALGLFYENQTSLRRAISYLRSESSHL